LLDQIDHFAARFAIAAKVGELILMQNDRTCADQLFAFYVAIKIRRNILVREHRGEFLLNRGPTFFEDD